MPATMQRLFASAQLCAVQLRHVPLLVLAARPAVGKSTLGLDIARYASIHKGDTSVIFSLEMSRSEITMRMLSAEARVPLNNIRSGALIIEFTAPIWIVLYLRFIKKKQISPLMWWGIGCAFGGLILISQVWSESTLSPIGFICQVDAHQNNCAAN